MPCCLSLQLTQGHTDRQTQRQLARKTDGQEERLYKSDKVKQREMTERWAAKNNRQDTRKQLPDTDGQIQVGATL